MATGAAYQYDTGYYGTAVPKRRPRPKEVPTNPRVVRKSKAALRRETRQARAQAIKLLSIAAVLLILLGFQVYGHVRVEELNRQIETVNSSISVMESENTRLTMDLNASASLNKVEDYAVNTLGMVKVQNYQVNYLNLSGGDSVEVSGGKSHQSLWKRIQIALKK